MKRKVLRRKACAGEIKAVPVFAVLLLFALLAALLPWTPMGRELLAEKEEVEPVIEDRAIEAVEEKPEEVSANLPEDQEEMTEGSDLLEKWKVEESEGLASVLREEGESCFTKFDVSLKIPTAAQTLGELESVNGNLGEILPGLEEMLRSAEVSSFYADLYERKVSESKKNFVSLETPLSMHNFFDTQTVLNLKHPETGQKVVLVQSEMDVVTDGSDGDRLPVMPLKNVQSTTYQFSTSWWWKKVTDRPNPMIAGFKGRIGNADRELAEGNADAERESFLKMRREMLLRNIEEAGRHSFLLAEFDPFIVMPTQMILDEGGSHWTRAGDYAVVIYKNRVYPCIVGDAGPSFKMGEASLRLAKELNSKASKSYRPISDLTVTYLVFPQSRGDRKPPNYAEWREACAGLLAQVGGLGEGVELFEWDVTLPPILEEAEELEESGEENPD